jgi:hypothetical protein
MPYMVVFRNADGKPGYHQSEALDEAARFVERLRNHEQITDARIFQMREVAIEFKTYYKVEVAAAGGEEAPEAEVTEPDEHAGDPTPAGAASGRFGRFGKG